MRIVTISLLCFLLVTPAAAVDAQEAQREALDIPALEAALPEEAGELLGQLSVTDALAPEGPLARLWSRAKELLFRQLREGVSGMTALVAVAILCAIGESFAPEGSLPYVELGGVVAASGIAVWDLRGFIGLGTETLHSLSDFSKALLPTMAAAAAAGGAVGSGTAKYAASAMFFDLLLTVGENLVTPVIYGYLALVIARAALGESMLTGAAALLKWGAGILITGLMLAFTLYLSITGVISGAADAATAKLAKTAISTALPVVGGILSDAAGTLVAGAGILRNGVGIFGMLGVLGVCIGPFLGLGARYLLYKGAASLSGTLAGERLRELIGGIGSAFAMLMGLVGAGAMMLFFSMVASLKAVTGL